MVEWILDRQVSRQFSEFERGFRTVCNSSLFANDVLRPDELERLVCGEQLPVDFGALQRATRYDGYRGTEDVTVKLFWEVVDEFTPEQKAKLMQFTTGSDRVPVGGLDKMQFVIARSGDVDRLPSSATCFNVLILPDYAEREKLRSALLLALANSEGFGLR